MFQAEEAPAACKAAAVSLLPAILFATGFLASLFVVLLARRSQGRGALPGEGWIFLAAISLRLIVLLAGGLAVYLIVKTERAQCIAAFALGVAAGWVWHFVFALRALRK